MHKFIKSCDIIFDEGGDQERIILKPDADDDSPTAIDSTSIPPTSPSPTSTTTLPDSRPKHTIHPPIPDNNPRYNISSYSPCTNLTDAETPEPKTYNEAMASPDAIKWLAACEDEM
jgi:hypothetical protein